MVEFQSKQFVRQHGGGVLNGLGVPNMLNGLDLFSGIGGLTLALAPWVYPIAYCENNRFAQAVLVSRIAGGELPPAPICTTSPKQML
jgi:hypothetical protein